MSVNAVIYLNQHYLITFGVCATILVGIQFRKKRLHMTSQMFEKKKQIPLILNFVLSHQNGERPM